MISKDENVYSVRLVHTVQEVDREAWNRATKGPFWSHEWFSFAEERFPDDAKPYYFLALHGDDLVAILPCFHFHSIDNTYENYFYGSFKKHVRRYPGLRRRALVCLAPHASGAYIYSDNNYSRQILQVLLQSFEETAAQEGFREVVFMCVKETEQNLIGLLQSKGYAAAFLNAAGIFNNRFDSFDGYLKSLRRTQKKSIKRDLAAFKKSGNILKTVSSQTLDVHDIYSLIAHVESKHPSLERDFTPPTLSTCFRHMRRYATHYFVESEGQNIGTNTLFEKDGILNSWAFGIDFEKARMGQTYFNLLYYNTIRKLIEQNAHHVNFNQMAYKVKESRGCKLVNQYMFVKFLRGNYPHKIWLSLLSRRYKRKFRSQYWEEQAKFRKQVDHRAEQR